MGFKTQLALRAAALLISMGVTAFLLTRGSYPTAAAVAAVVSVLLVVELGRCVSRTNRELARLLDAVRYEDFGQRFELDGLGSGFQELGSTFADILKGFRAQRGIQEKELRHLKAVVEHVPVPLISVGTDERVDVWNNAARRLFEPHGATTVTGLEVFGSELPHALRTVQPGQKVLIDMRADDSNQRLVLSTSEIVTEGGTERLVSLQNIQTELESMQLQAWQDLVRVLTHEMMNSITPVASLARTASDLVRDVSGRLEGQEPLLAELTDVRDAVDTVARRSDGLMAFVESYQRLMRLPAPERSRFDVVELFADVSRMVTIGWPDRDMTLDTSVDPPGLALVADRRMIEQVLINLLQNAEHAIDGRAGARVELSARFDGRGRVRLEVSDNGPGISPEVAARMFVPFFTTRSNGSGVGLALSRQIMNAHGGGITYHPVDDAGGATGARFVLTF